MLGRTPSPGRLAVVLVLAGCLARAAGAWGTAHTEITRFAFRQLPASDRAEARLGGVRQMEDLCWGGDYQGDVTATHYVDDYLLFPEFPTHSSHLMPGVADTWSPFFRRTLQALRGESPANAARWMGSLLHFVQDSGSPPHAFPTTGPLHTRMENYVFNFDIRLAGYNPRELGADDAAAEIGLEERMRALVAFSRERGQRLRPLAERNDRLACEPLELECALESLRATADVAHTLLRLSRDGPRSDCGGIKVSLRAPATPDFPLAPTRLLLTGATGEKYSTVADARAQAPGAAQYEAVAVLRNLPPGAYQATFLRTGCLTVRRAVRVEKGRETRWSITLPGDMRPGNLIRNPDLSVRWLSAGGRDHWTPTGGEWRSDTFRVEPGRRYRVGARDPAGARPVRLEEGDVPRIPPSAPREEPGMGGEWTARFSYARLVVPGSAAPAAVWVAPTENGAGTTSSRLRR